MESPKTNPCPYDQLIHDKGGKNTKWGKDNKWCCSNWTATYKKKKRKKKLGYYLIQYTKISSKWIKGLNVKPETIKLLEENRGSMLIDTDLSNIFLDIFPQARETKAKTHKYTVKETTVKTKRQPSEWEKIFANHISDKG